MIDYFGYEWTSYDHTKWVSDWYDHAYFGPAGVSTIEGNSNKIKLSIECRPLEFTFPINPPHSGPDAVTKEFCCGELIGPAMTYGEYEWEVEMPVGKHLWPALWLCGAESWPPEIDVVEGYTQNKGDYKRFNWETTLEINFHKRKNKTNGTHVNMGAKGIPMWKYLLWHKKVDKYSCVWTKDVVKVYFNGHLIRETKDPEFLADLNEAAKMKPIMNMMVDNKFKFDPNNRPQMIIHNFRYTPYNI